MSTSNLQLTALADELYRRAAPIPFGNSDVQNAAFVEGAQITPERAYRAVLLQLDSALQALQSTYYQQQREDVAIRRLQARIDNPETDPFDREEAAIDLEEKRIQRKRTEKLVADALHQVSWFEARMQAYPEYTRAQFEAGEGLHFTLRLERQSAGLAGAHEALINLRHDAIRLNPAVKAVLALPPSQPQGDLPHGAISQPLSAD